MWKFISAVDSLFLNRSLSLHATPTFSHGPKSASAPLRIFRLRESAAELLSSFRTQKSIRSLFHFFSCSSTFNSSGSLKVHIAKRHITCAETIKVILIYDTFVCSRCRAVKAQLKKILLQGINPATRQALKAQKFPRSDTEVELGEDARESSVLTIKSAKERKISEEIAEAVQ